MAKRKKAKKKKTVRRKSAPRKKRTSARKKSQKKTTRKKTTRKKTTRRKRPATRKKRSGPARRATKKVSPPTPEPYIPPPTPEGSDDFFLPSDTTPEPAGVVEDLGDDFDSLDKGPLGGKSKDDDGEDSLEEVFGEDSKGDLDDEPFRGDA